MTNMRTIKTGSNLNKENKFPVNRDQTIENVTLVIFIKILLLLHTVLWICLRCDKYFNEFGQHPAAQY